MGVFDFCVGFYPINAAAVLGPKAFRIANTACIHVLILRVIHQRLIGDRLRHFKNLLV